MEDVYRSVQFAVDYHVKFKKDIMLDIYGYRKYGHNEVDEPSFTQPIMYNNIRNVHQAIPLKYTSQLAKEGLVDASFYDQTREKIF
jgi:2-oxoglutarate dehydrogenase complex dehydrogenase (E1) component-like enzyme